MERFECESCGTLHDGSYGSGRFCSAKCARSFSTKDVDYKKTKSVFCTVCGSEHEINKRASAAKFVCKACRSYESRRSIEKLKSCTVCGTSYEYGLDGKQHKVCKRPDICKRHQLLPTLEKYFGFDMSTVGTLGVYEEFDRIRNVLMEDYWDNGLSIPHMVEKYGHYDIRNFGKILKSLDVERRCLPESQLNHILHNEEYQPSHSFQYKYGFHTTWNGKSVFYRSSYELEYAKELDEKQVDYDMEALRILYWDSQLLRQRIAIPDFYLPETNTIVEIKSNYTLDVQNMKDKRKEYKRHGYNFELVCEKVRVDLNEL